jgi:hypothetical protein
VPPLLPVLYHGVAAWQVSSPTVALAFPHAFRSLSSPMSHCSRPGLVRQLVTESVVVSNCVAETSKRNVTTSANEIVVDLPLYARHLSDSWVNANVSVIAVDDCLRQENANVNVDEIAKTSSNSLV